MGDPADAPDQLDGGVLATFQVGNERFRLWATNPDTIDTLLAIANGEQPQAIPNGPLLEGPGPGDYNEPWSWRQHPEQTEMAEVTIELCDGNPNFVEEELDYWLENVGRYCPWSAHLVELTDLRQRGQ